LQAVTCNDDYTNTASKVYFNVSAGQTYYLMVSSFEGAGGDLNFSIDEVPENLELSVSVDDKAWVNAGTGRATVTGELTCSEPATVAIELSIGQGNRDGSGYLPVDCDGNERWLLQAFGRFNAGRAGIDVTAYWTDDDSVRATASLVANLRACTIIGSLGDDSISGSSRNDKICSLAGDDTLRGKGGNDQLRGHDGDDVAIGGPGDDLLTGGYGLDELRAGRGDDALYGDAGADTLSGGPGKDKCIGGPGRDVLRSCERRN
jgi:Ca2+-binding RTX toxin-like protein